MISVLPAQTWSWGDSLRLVSWSLLWFALVLPAAVFEGLVLAAVSSVPGWTVGDGTWWGDLGSAASWTLFLSAYAVVPAVAGAAVALPLTKVLGSAMRRVRCRAVHVAADAVLAGVLAAVPVAVVPELWVVFVPLPVAAASAAALARAVDFWRRERVSEAVGVRS